MLVFSYLLVSCGTDEDDEPIRIESNNANNTTYTDKEPNTTSNEDDNYTIENDTNDNGTSENKPNDNNDEGQNILKNGGLEIWRAFTLYDMPDNWLCHNNNNVTKEYKIVYEGRCSAKMQSKETGSTATVNQNVPVESGSMIRIRFHYYVEQWKSNGARTYCYFRTRAAESSTISADELKAFYDKNTYYIIHGGGYGVTYLPHELNVWQLFDETIQVPPTATYFVFGINSYYGTTIYIDDCYVTEK